MPIPSDPASFDADDKLLQWLRAGVIGAETPLKTPFGERKKVYFDYTASAPPFQPIEDFIAQEVLPYYANTHSSAACGDRLSRMLDDSEQQIRQATGANDDDLVLFCGSGTTAAVNRLISILGLDQWRQPATAGSTATRPVIFVSEMEHHSNDLPWRESAGDLVSIGFDEQGRISVAELRERLAAPGMNDRPARFGAFSAASNATGIVNDVAGLAQAMHDYDGYAFFDYAAAGPYLPINMHPGADGADQDAIFLSPHKFIGGPQTPGILIFRSALVQRNVPAEVGGGTVLFTSPWEHVYDSNLQVREQAGTPPIVQIIRAALVFQLKQLIGSDRIMQIEERYCNRILGHWRKHPKIQVLNDKCGCQDNKHCLGIFSVIFDDTKLHHKLAVRLLSDVYGIQARGGWMCAGPYGHHLLEIDEHASRTLREKLEAGTGRRPGWVRFSVSPVTTDAEVEYLLESVDELLERYPEWSERYSQDPKSGEWCPRGFALDVPRVSFNHPE